MDKHSPSAHWKQKFQWRELLLCALKPKNIYFRKIPEVAVIFHILSFFLRHVVSSGSFCELTLCLGFGFVSVLPWFIACQITFILVACQDGVWAKNTAEQELPRAWPASTGQIQLHSPSLWSQSSLLGLEAGREPLAIDDSWLRRHFVTSAADLLLSRPSVQPLLEKRNCSLCSLSCVWPSCHLGRPAALFLACTSISTASGNYPTHLS